MRRCWPPLLLDGLIGNRHLFRGLAGLDTVGLHSYLPGYVQQLTAPPAPNGFFEQPRNGTTR